MARVFEAKQGDTILLEKIFVRNDQLKIASSDVLVFVFALPNGFDQAPIETYGNYIGEPFVVGEKAMLNTVNNRYEYSLKVGQSWGLGTYLVRWNATIESGQIFEWDRLMIIGATTQDIADVMGMPNSVSANGITVDYSQKLDNMTSQRPIDVGQISKDRSRAVPDTRNKDYDRRKRE